MILQMTSTGEESGELETMLNKAADFYEREVREAVDNMSKLIEPIMISVLGGTGRHPGRRDVSAYLQDGLDYVMEAAPPTAQ